MAATLLPVAWMCRQPGLGLVPVLALVLGLGACGKSEERSRPRPPRATERGGAGATDEPVSLLSADGIEPITEAIERDESLEACMERERDGLGTAVREALTDLGYDTFVEDVCRGERALHAKDTSLCDAIPTASLRTSCVVRVALARGEADACPRTPDGGRDALCVALASGDERLCRAVPAYHEPRCRAILRDEPRACGEVRELHRGECEGLVARLAPLVSPRRRSGPRLAASTWQASAERVLADGSRVAESAPASPPLDRGIVVRTVGCERRIVIDDPTSRPMVRLGRTLPTRLEVSTPPGATFPRDVPLGLEASIGLHLPPAEPIDSVVGSRGHVRIVAFEPVRGGRVELSVDADLPFHQDRLLVQGTLTTFVRDLDPLEPHCTSAAPEAASSPPRRHGRATWRMR
ncbi:MAG: hypothetical protein U0230_22700 [Polyangiales bacterium]